MTTEPTDTHNPVPATEPLALRLSEGLGHAGGEGEIMETLDEFNSRRRQQCEALNMPGPRPNGIACPKCGKELLDSDPSMILTSSPPTKNVLCPACGYGGYRVA